MILTCSGILATGARCGAEFGDLAQFLAHVEAHNKRRAGAHR